MVAKGMQDHGTSMRRLAQQFRVTEGAVRYRLRKLEEGPREDGRAKQPTALDDYAAAVGVIQEELEDGRLTGEGRPCQVQMIYEILVRDHGYGGSYQAVVRHLRRKHGRPRLRAFRRVEDAARCPGTARLVRRAGSHWTSGAARPGADRHTVA